jgi:hypothetical protein
MMLTLAAQARKLAAAGRGLEEAGKASRSASEREEAEGAATQGPAEGLLRDSRRLNDQSNLVLDQSHSPQAKALAALDLKMAQSLAQRAADGMADAKAHFASAIAARKQAVADDVAAAADVTKAAQASLVEQPDDAALVRVVRGGERGERALADVVTADVAALDAREEHLGDARAAAEADGAALAAASERVAALGQEAAAVRRELSAAEATVRRAAAAQASAVRLLREATAQSVSAEARSDTARGKEARGMRARLAAVVAQKRRAERAYQAAMRHIAGLSGHQTLLQVRLRAAVLRLLAAHGPCAARVHVGGRSAWLTYSLTAAN